jgi:hypothetical protein
MPDYHVSMAEWLARLIGLVPSTVVVPMEWVRRDLEEDRKALEAVERMLREKKW